MVPKIVSHLANIHLMCVFARRCPIGSENSCAVAIGISVNDGNGFVKTISLQDDEHRSKDLLFVTSHVWLKQTAAEGFLHHLPAEHQIL